VREIEGSFSNVVGLPADEVRAALVSMEIPVKAIQHGSTE
jgi:predicted house-cleaning NTP pyrophosphatase (Maf/HAM1 superfamily)